MAKYPNGYFTKEGFFGFGRHESRETANQYLRELRDEIRDATAKNNYYFDMFQRGGREEDFQLSRQCQNYLCQLRAVEAEVLKYI